LLIRVSIIFFYKTPCCPLCPPTSGESSFIFSFDWFFFLPSFIAFFSKSDLSLPSFYIFTIFRPPFLLRCSRELFSPNDLSLLSVPAYGLYFHPIFPRTAFSHPGFASIRGTVFIHPACRDPPFLVYPELFLPDLNLVFLAAALPFISPSWSTLLQPPQFYV